MGNKLIQVFLVILVVAVTLQSSTASAYDIQNPRQLALGGGSRAFCPSNGSLYLNPAGMGIARTYNVEMLYGYVPTANSHIAGASVVDSVTAPIAMGLSFNYIAWDPRGINRNEYDVRLSAAYYIAQLLSVGLTLKYVYAHQKGRGPLTTNLFVPNGDEMLNTVTVDVGTTLTIGDVFSVAVVGYNLTNTESTHAPLSLGIGLALTLSSFVVVGDMLMDFTSAEDLMFEASGGAEYLVSGNWPIRLGYRWDQILGTHSVTGGFGYVSQRFGIELSIRQDVSSPDDHLHTHLALGIRYFAQ